MEALVQLLLRHLPTLLLLYWGLAAGAAIVALTPLPFAEGFRHAVMLSACRGKLMDLRPPRALGPLSDATVPQSWFTHFYALGAAWNTAVSLAFFASQAYAALPAADRAMCVAALTLLQLHLARRLLETVWLMRYTAGARMHLVAYVFGLSYYLLVPLMLLPGESLPSTYAAAKRVLLAGRLAPAPGLPPLSTLLAALSPLQLAGAAVFLFANLLQLDSHLLLAQLAAHPRRGSGSSSAATGPQSSTTAAAGAAAGTYSIPHGRGFELVSCPHYLAEILVYVGLVLLERGGGLAHWLMLAWVVSNLLLAAGMTQRWYRRQFKSYPPARRAIIPFLY